MMKVHLRFAFFRQASIDQQYLFIAYVPNFISGLNEPWRIIFFSV